MYLPVLVARNMKKKLYPLNFDDYSDCSSMVVSCKVAANKLMEANKKKYIPKIISTDNKNKVPANKVPTNNVIELNKKISGSK